MPEVQVKNRGKEEALSEDEKLHRIEELRKLIEGKSFSWQLYYFKNRI